VFLNLLLRSNVVLCLLFVLKLYGYAVFLRSLGFLRLLLLLFMLITPVLFKLSPILFSINVPSIWRLIVILFGTSWKVEWYLFLTSLLISKWLMSLPKLWSNNGINFLLANCCWFTSINLRRDVIIYNFRTPLILVIKIIFAWIDAKY
jgi:hypothetical protein